MYNLVRSGLPSNAFSLDKAKHYFEFARVMFAIDLKGWDNALICIPDRVVADGVPVYRKSNTCGKYLINGNSASLIIHEKGSKEVTVLFDPSDCYRDWIDNLTPYFKDIAIGGSVLAGFHRAIMRRGENDAPLHDRVIDELNRLHKDEGVTRINFSGYSRGGGMATAFIAEAVEHDRLHERFEFGDFYSYGAPYIGNAQFARKFGKLAQECGLNLWRIETDGDPVPRLTSWLNSPVGNLALITKHRGNPFQTHIHAFFDEPPGEGNPQRQAKPFQSGDISRIFGEAQIRRTGLGHQHYSWSLWQAVAVTHHQIPADTRRKGHSVMSEIVPRHEIATLPAKAGGGNFPIPDLA